MTDTIRGILTPAERASAMRFGMYLKFASAGIRPSQIDSTLKTAAGTAPQILSPSGMFKAIVTVAVLTGVPLGIAAHVVGRHVRDARGKETELKAQTGYYQNASRQLNAGLAASGSAV